MKCCKRHKSEAKSNRSNGDAFWSKVSDKPSEPFFIQGKFKAKPRPSTKIQAQLNNSKGQGKPMSKNIRKDMESSFGLDFKGINIHTDRRAAQMNEDIGAKAFTHGKDIYFNGGAYDNNSKEGKRLLAHELTHVVQQNTGDLKIQKQGSAWRYTPPASVTRSIEEIQAIVGSTPDGVYGPKTRDAVKRYQTKLKAIIIGGTPLYNDTIDGKWGGNTDNAHDLFATSSLTHSYNCSGLAFKTFRFHNMTSTDSILAGMTKMPSCASNCNPGQFKFFHWKYDVSLTNTITGVTGPSHRDFHIVGGQTNGSGAGPSVVMSKNGSRPVKGPAAPMSWKPVTAPARRNNFTDAVIPNLRKNRTGHVESCFCSDTLPP